MKARSSRPIAHFEALYRSNPDPWGFETSAYEQQKYDATIAALPAGTFARGFEAGCSIGVLTSRLAARCGSLLAVDVVPAALAAARLRCTALPHVQFGTFQLPHEWPDETFDLMVFSEILYFLTQDDVRLAARKTLASLAAGGTVMLVNYTGKLDDPCSGNEAADIFMDASPHLTIEKQIIDTRYRIDVLVKP